MLCLCLNPPLSQKQTAPFFSFVWIIMQ
jgi:hypothetical protein